MAPVTNRTYVLKNAWEAHDQLHVDISIFKQPELYTLGQTYLRVCPHCDMGYTDLYTFRDAQGNWPKFMNAVEALDRRIVERKWDRE